jgi:DNA replication and repair protein RecF
LVEPEDRPAALPLEPRGLALEHLVVRDLRNLARVEIAPALRLSVIGGGNGQGKTSLLEAIYFAATSRSFRTPRLGELVRHGAEVASVRARFVEAGDGPPLAREQIAAVQDGRAVVRIDQNRPASLADFATRSPVIVFHPEELALTRGPAPLRRTLLDRVALFMDAASADHRARYAKALRERQELLRRGDVDAAELDVFEELCARHGAALTRARRRAAQVIATELDAAFARIAAPDLALETRFFPGGSDEEDTARAELARRRRGDARRKSAAFGPHRDDLDLLLGGHPARVVGSQGQHRALTLALKAAEAACVATARGVSPILLLDDVSSELDRDRTQALFAFLGGSRGQIVLTTTRPELIDAPGTIGEYRQDFHVEGGVVTSVR